MRFKIIFLTIVLVYNRVSIAQTYIYDNNHQVIEIRNESSVVVSIQYDANGNRVSYIASGAALPVTLLSFSAQKSSEQTLLTWATSEEANNDKFEIEYSKDGNSFSSFTSVPAKGNSSTRTEYSTIHCCPIEGVNYYRLKMVDKDGKYKYSEIRKVVFEFINVMKVYPNPSSDKSVLNISFTKPFSKDANMAIYSSNGALIRSLVLTRGEALAQINTSLFSAGSYYIIATVDGKTYKKEFIKQ